MKENKNIERLFQEKFKDFEALPPEESWDIIANRLNEKKKRIVPIWFQFSGIAASLFIIGFLIWNFLGENTPIKVPNSDSTVVNTQDSKGKSNNSNITLPNNEAIVFDSHSNEKKLNKKSNNSILQNKENSIDKKLVNSELKNNSIERNGWVSNEKLNNNSNSNQKGFKKEKNNFKKQSSSKVNFEKVLVTNTEKNKTKGKPKSKFNKNNSVFENLFDDNNVVNNSREDKTPTNKETIDAFFENKTSNTTTINNNGFITKQTNNSDVVVSNKIITQNSTLVAEISKDTNPLEELLKEKEAGKNEDEKEEKRNKWAVSTNASPVYFNSLAEGSSIDEQFNSNRKDYTTTLSYGISTSFFISNKLSVRAGINNINLSYNTNDVVYDSKMRSVENNVPNISRNEKATNIVFTSKNNIIETLSSDVENIAITENTGSLKQNISYIEVPLEISYKILDKKFKVEIIGGMSTLFLNNNSISLLTDGMEMNVGKANNLNNIHFSSNVGFGFKYNFWKSFDANFQPMFKYQINSFSENSSNFKPYFIGLYTGFSFSF
ncbi:hypothetical protein [uncultured Flavobacterium sp.]|uniref:hypothetical protein n=1 Tax=uncultured Flavobacterium sp. TaxID=165435 RepID=UPI00260BF187|nr:hypothetical protein [uncultured Flavobacterium sp.]